MNPISTSPRKGKPVTGYKKDLLNILVLYARNVHTDGEDGIRLEEAADLIEKLFADKHFDQTFKN